MLAETIVTLLEQLDEIENMLDELSQGVAEADKPQTQRFPGRLVWRANEWRNVTVYDLREKLYTLQERLLIDQP